MKRILIAVSLALMLIPLFVGCNGDNSKNAANELAALGYTNIKEFGGINDWKYGTVTE